MEKYTVYGELLYVGFVYEKGRCPSSELWKLGYKRKLYKHISMLKKIIQCILNKDVTNVDAQMVNQFAQFINEEEEIGKHYPISKKVQETFGINDYSIISSVDESKNCSKINNLMLCLTNDILELLEYNMSVNKKKVAMLLRALHNLPRIYLDRNVETLCNINQSGIEISDALNYSSINMDETTRQKYKEYLH